MKLGKFEIIQSIVFTEGAVMKENNSTWNESARDIPLNKSYDVLVAGGGTAGVCAAIAAARGGAKTLLIEQFGSLGGTQTAGLVTQSCPNFYPDGRPLTAGIGQELLDRLCKFRMQVRPNSAPDIKAWASFDQEVLRYVEEQLVLESGCDLLYHTWVSLPMMEGNRVTGLIIENKSGRCAYSAKVVIDATGDADVVYRSGAPCETGRPEDGLNQPSSLRFCVGNVDLDRLSAFLKTQDVPFDLDGMPTVSFGMGGGGKDLSNYLSKCIAEHKVASDDVRYFQFFSSKDRPSEISFNCPELRYFQGTDAQGLTLMQIEGRKCILRLIDFCRRCLPGFEDCYLVSVALMPGVRVSRRAVTDYVLTVDEVINGKRFEDAVARNNWPPDIHAIKESEALRLDHQPVDFVEIPYRALLPKDVEGLLVAGRSIGTDFTAQAAIRISRTCQALGEAAGTAAAMAVAKNITPRQVDGIALHQTLVKNGLM